MSLCVMHISERCNSLCTVIYLLLSFQYVISLFMASRCKSILEHACPLAAFLGRRKPSNHTDLARGDKLAEGNISSCFVQPRK